jgi:aspartate/methionine/tyrosine aminotransferase
MDENTFAEKLLQEEHVAVIPGSAFGPQRERVRPLLLCDGVRED